MVIRAWNGVVSKAPGRAGPLIPAEPDEKQRQGQKQDKRQADGLHPQLIALAGVVGVVFVPDQGGLVEFPDAGDFISVARKLFDGVVAPACIFSISLSRCRAWDCRCWLWWKLSNSFRRIA